MTRTTGATRVGHPEVDSDQAFELLATAELSLARAEADRITLRDLLRRATEEREAEERRASNPVLLCHHAELLSLLVRRLAETELSVLRSRLEADRHRASIRNGRVARPKAKPVGPRPVASAS